MYLKSSVLGDEWAPHASRCRWVKSQNKSRKMQARTHVNSRATLSSQISYLISYIPIFLRDFLKKHHLS
jgi:hypothetical protein